MGIPEAIPNKKELESRFERLKPAYDSVLAELEKRISYCLERCGVRPTIKGRVKSFESYFTKLIRLLRSAKENGLKKPIPLTDMLGLRIVCPFLEDLSLVEEELQKNFKVMELERKGANHTFKEFGYESVHILIEIPQDLKKPFKGFDVGYCEIQIRTILQDAWAEVEHELVYKAEFDPLDSPMKRKLAALNANLFLSDITFQEIRDYQHQLNGELSKRRTTFYSKIEDKIDGSFFRNGNGKKTADSIYESYSALKTSIDDLLLAALQAHNKEDFVGAIDIYTKILDMSPKPLIKSLIHKHRGMAYFAESRYEEAALDFSLTLDIDPSEYKAAYYLGVTHSVRENYRQAIEDFNRSLEINPYQFFCLYRRSQAYFHIGDYPKSLSDCEKALNLQPESENALKLREYIRLKLAM